MRKGLRVKLDGYVRREWVTDEDEWTWLPEHDSAPLPHQLELMRTMVDDGADKGDLSSKGAESKTSGPKAEGKAKLPTSPKVPASPAVQNSKAAAPVAKHADVAGDKSLAHAEKETEKAPRPVSSGKPKGKGKAAADKGESKPEKGAKSGGSGQMVSGSTVNGGSSHDDENGAGGVADGQMATVTIANGPHTGKECKVLHVGNGWVKLQLPNGTVMHMRKWDLHGDVPLKLRSPGSKTSSKPSRTFEADVEAASKAPSQKSKRDRSDGRQTEVDGTAGASTEKAASVNDSHIGQNGFTLGTHVWARWSGIKFSRGVISKLLTSSKWVLVTFESEQSQWVTSREMVLDEEVRHESLEEGTEVIAAWEDDDKFYKGRIMGKSSNGRYRVRYDDWDDALVMIEGIRLLPEGFALGQGTGAI
ncbi:hypothetical protein Ctob_014102 [Chrysochromulina tobinii]|uniref:Tudor domain-containing protein n=1 Tax=Chrysochromulina tobinii TaxID=1460289 RepID=A0A0M0JQJ4_9EUKA|nr:hypothetical protein Ctob_014102 [Chrysochromulina tobinii]|eukprot:KOO28567.1 hypothetical protein Ctob_014102 [Chrysochromulina sp. CCMP291]